MFVIHVEMWWYMYYIPDVDYHKVREKKKTIGPWCACAALSGILLRSYRHARACAPHKILQAARLLYILVSGYI